jgi:hypothetical protein
MLLSLEAALLSIALAIQKNRYATCMIAVKTSLGAIHFA